MSDNIDVSVVMLAYNHEKYIKKALDSVLAQKFDGKLEIVIGEDCSLDTTKKIIEEYCESYPSLIVPIYQNPNVGATKNQYSVLKKARGRYLAFLECDDFWTDENKIQIQVDFLDKNSEYVAVYHNYLIVDSEERLCEKPMNPYVHTEFSCRDYEKGNFPSHTATCLCRNFFNEKSCRILVRGHSLINDRTWVLLFLERGRIKVLDAFMSSYRKVISMKAENACSLQLKNNMFLEQWDYYNALEKYALEHDIKLDMGYLKIITFIQAFERFLRVRGKDDFKILKSVFNKSQSKIYDLSFLLKIILEQLKYKLFHIRKKTAAEIYFANRRIQDGA